MTRPIDAAIARDRVKLWFFRDMTDDQRIALLKLFRFPANEMGTHGAQTHGLRHVFDALSAAEFDAESPAGTERGSEEVMQIDLDRSEEGNAVARGEEGKTSPQLRTCTIPTCRAEMRPGLRCSSPHCGLKE